ncbi:MAG: c-type cytochrome [Bacteroidetes bacterium]|nr:c-type cytochrome [Bacteroidota bacterium]
MKFHKLISFLTALLVSTNLLFADAAEGEKLFNANCTACHAINDKVVGPALKDVDKRHSEAWNIKWVKNSQAMVKSGDAEALKIFNEFNQMPMTSFAQFNDEQIKSILAYIKTGGPTKPAATATDGVTKASPVDSIYNDTTLYGLMLIAFILIIIVWVLIRIRKVVDQIFEQKHPEIAAAEIIKHLGWRNNRKSFRFKMFKKHPVVGTLVVMTIFTVVFGLIGFDYGNKKVGVQKEYAPTQPIAYSHELHAGKYKINCQYCHSGADKSKQATIPSASTCMNCHAHVTAKEKYNGKVSPEIQKIYTAIGWDPEKRSYIPDYKKQPIKWIRIHNLPDHAYFNHSQHVKIGKVECQACHGPVETMKVVSQQRSLQMGWCINCHREAKVDVANNKYYEELHKNLKAEGKSITVAQNGGLECAKCHY